MINFIKAICGNPTFHFKMEIRLVYTEAKECVKIQKIMSCKLNCSIKNFNFMATFYGWGSAVSRLHSHYEETVSFLRFSFQISRSSWYSIDCPRKDEKLSWPCSHPVVSNLGPPDWESNTLRTRPLHVSTCHNEA